MTDETPKRPTLRDRVEKTHDDLLSRVAAMEAEDAAQIAALRTRLVKAEEELARVCDSSGGHASIDTRLAAAGAEALDAAKKLDLCDTADPLRAVRDLVEYAGACASGCTQLMAQSEIANRVIKLQMLASEQRDAWSALALAVVQAAKARCAAVDAFSKACDEMDDDGTGQEGDPLLDALNAADAALRAALAAYDGAM